MVEKHTVFSIHQNLLLVICLHILKGEQKLITLYHICLTRSNQVYITILQN